MTDVTLNGADRTKLGRIGLIAKSLSQSFNFDRIT